MEDSAMTFLEERKKKEKWKLEFQFTDNVKITKSFKKAYDLMD